MSEYRLHCFAQSGNAYKPALALALAGADWQQVFVDFFNGETRTPAYRALNPMGEVPVLEHRETRLTQSGVILDYLTETAGPRIAAKYADAIDEAIARLEDMPGAAAPRPALGPNIRITSLSSGRISLSMSTNVARKRFTSCVWCTAGATSPRTF